MSTLRSTLSYYYHYDGLGSMIAISDESGNTIERYEYSVYGKVNIVAKQNGERREVSIVANPYYFTGRRLDTETGRSGRLKNCYRTVLLLRGEVRSQGAWPASWAGSIRIVTSLSAWSQSSGFSMWI